MSLGVSTGASPDDRRRRLTEALRARRSAPAPLAPNQERLLFLQQLDPASVAYLETVILRLGGPLDTALLLAALLALPTRHEWLRSRIDVRPDGPVQVVDDQLRPEVHEADLRPAATGRPAGGAADPDPQVLDPTALAWVRLLAETPLSLADGPLWRAGLARLGDDSHLLVLVVHHIACDASSLAVLVDEVGQRYEALLSGVGLTLREPRSPRDLARAVREAQTSPAAEQAVAVQVEKLLAAALEARLGSFGDGRPGPVHVVRRSVPQRVGEQVHRLGAAYDVAPFAIVCAAIGAALADAMEIDTPVIGVPVDLRWCLPESEETVSFLVETVAVVLPDVLVRPPADTMAVIRDAVAAALEDPPPFAKVVAGVRHAGLLPPTGTPVHAYVTWLEGGEADTLGTGGPTVTHLDPPVGHAKFDLSWTVVDSGADLALRLEYDSTTITVETAERLIIDTVRLLDAVTRDAEVPIADRERVPDAELAQISEWEGEPAHPPDLDLFTAVRHGLARAPGPVLLAQGKAWTAPELLDQVDALAASLTAAGVGPGTRVAVSSHRVPGMVVTLLAVLRAGGTFLPIDAAHPRARQVKLACSAHVGVVVGEGRWAKDLARALAVPAVVTNAAGAPLLPGSLDVSWPARGSDDLAYVMFTSGSTGHPKAVRVPDSAVVARINSYRTVLADGNVRWLLQSPLTFDASIYLFWVLAVGGCLVLPEDRDAGDPVALSRLVEQHGVTDAFFVPAVYEALLRVAAPGAVASFRRVCVGGDVFPAAVAALHHVTIPDAALLNVYGPTEVVVTATAALIAPHDHLDGRLPIGRPHPGTVARVLDRHGRRLPVGAVGELHLGGPSVADGYDDAADEVAGPFSVGRDGRGRPVRWYATGDLVRWRTDGQLDYVGRRDRQVKLRGQRVDLGEVEVAACSLSGVHEAAAELLGPPDAPRLALFVAPEVEGVRETLAAVLPEAWVPDMVVLRRVLPRLPSGKVDRATLRSEASPAPLRVLPAPDVNAVRKSPGLGPAVLSMVRIILGRDDVGPDDDFFAAGGDSLLAARLTGQLSAVLGVTLPLHELLGRSTVRGIAALADEYFGQEAISAQHEARLVPVRDTGSKPPIVLITRDGETSLVLRHFLTRLDSDRPLWALVRPMPALGLEVPDIRLTGEVVAAALLEQFPQGPVHLLGHSASGLVAVEAARLLGDGRRGATVLLDTPAPPSWYRIPLRRAAVASNLVRRRLALAYHRDRVPAPGDPPPPSTTTHRLRGYQDNQAVLRLRMRPVDFPLTLLVAEESREEYRSDDLGWHRWASNVQFLPIPGDHISLLVQPHVEETLRQIEGALRQWS